eukprot:GILK01007164.1.p1 GENE.GILK01007164.1~~GILK01007164.1.p1  ORF type:complete len:514 (-),score=38.52 GILK01007164.1:68-1609(-)
MADIEQEEEELPCVSEPQLVSCPRCNKQLLPERLDAHIKRNLCILEAEAMALGTVELVKCEVCQRSFAPDRIDKHKQICGKKKTSVAGQAPEGENDSKLPASAGPNGAQLVRHNSLTLSAPKEETSRAKLQSVSTSKPNSAVKEDPLPVVHKRSSTVSVAPPPSTRRSPPRVAAAAGGGIKRTPPRSRPAPDVVEGTLAGSRGSIQRSPPRPREEAASHKTEDTKEYGPNVTPDRTQRRASVDGNLAAHQSAVERNHFTFSPVVYDPQDTDSGSADYVQATVPSFRPSVADSSMTTQHQLNHSTSSSHSSRSPWSIGYPEQYSSSSTSAAHASPPNEHKSSPDPQVHYPHHRQSLQLERRNSEIRASHPMVGADSEFMRSNLIPSETATLRRAPSDIHAATFAKSLPCSRASTPPLPYSSAYSASLGPVCRGVVVYFNSVHEDHILGEVIVKEEVTVAQVRRMISEELGLGDASHFQIKKRNIPIPRGQDHRLALDFFRSDDDFIVLTQSREY